MATSEDPKDPRLERLYDYTKFHIGIYIAAAGGLIAIASADELDPFLVCLPKHVCLLYGAIASMFVAGAAGGIIVSNCVVAWRFESIWKTNIGPWNCKLMPGRYWARIEHAAFWISALLFTAAALLPC